MRRRGTQPTHIGGRSILLLVQWLAIQAVAARGVEHDLVTARGHFFSFNFVRPIANHIDPSAHPLFRCGEAHSNMGDPMPPFRPMNQFDPSRPSLVHDRLHAKTFEWSPEWRTSFEQYKREAGLGIVAWDGLLLDGWAPLEVDPFRPFPRAM